MALAVILAVALAACGGGGGGSVEGTVTKGGSPAANAQVKLVSAPDFVAETESDDQGRFRFEGVEPGTYFLTVLDPCEVGALAPIQVDEDEQVTVPPIECPS